MSFNYCKIKKDCPYQRLIMTTDKKVVKGIVCVGNKKYCVDEQKRLESENKK